MSRPNVASLLWCWRQDGALRHGFPKARGPEARRRLLAEHGLALSAPEFAEMMRLVRQLARADHLAPAGQGDGFAHYGVGDWRRLLARLRALQHEPCA